MNTYISYGKFINSNALILKSGWCNGQHFALMRQRLVGSNPLPDIQMPRLS